jgi:FKBP-type peptidyl-prolyl cis-trans isomerase FklB
MNKVLLIIISFALSGTMMAQQKTAKPTKPNTAAKPRPQQPLMKTPLDSMSYAIGMSISQFYKQQGIGNFNAALVNKAILDSKSGKTLLNEEQMNMSISNYLQKLKAEKASGNKQTGEAFLAANKTKPGVITLPSGLQYIVVKEGTGPKPTINDKVKCHYHGTLIDGTVFDSSVDRGQPIDFPVGGVIKGWVEALQLMPVGSKWKLFIPSDLAYGDNQAGAKIGPGSTLIFDVELIDIVK